MKSNAAHPPIPVNTTLSSLIRYTTGVALLLVLLVACYRSDPTPQVSASASATTPAPAAAPAAPVAQATQPTAEGEFYVEGDIPPPQSEVMIPRPGPDVEWVAGYWGFEGGRREWVRGHWERPPHAHATWVAPRWEPRGRGHVFIRGYWR